MKRGYLKYIIGTLLMALAITLFLVLPASAATEGDFTYSVVSGKATITRYSGSDTDIVIPTEIGGYPVGAIGSYFMQYNSKAENVILPDADITIQNYAFQYLSSNDTVTVPASVTNIASEAFGSYYSTGIVYLSYGSAMHEYALEHPFVRFVCTDKTYSYTVSGSNCTLTGYHGPKIARLPSTIDGYKLTAIGKDAFKDSIVERVYVPDTVTTVASGAFTGMRTERLTVLLPSSVTSINASSIPFEQYWRYGEDEYDEYYIEVQLAVILGSRACKIFYDNNDLYSNTWLWDGGDYLYREIFYADYPYTFDGYLGDDKDIVLPTTINGGAVGGIYYGAFPDGCGFDTIVVPEGYTEIGYCAFGNGCAKDIYLPRSINYIEDDAFNFYSKSATIHVYSNTFAQERLAEMGVEYELTDIEDYTYTEDSSGITITAYNPASGGEKIYIPGTVKGKAVTAIGPNVFTGSNAKHIIVPASVKSIGDGAFSGVCENEETLIEILNTEMSFGKDVFDANSLLYLTYGSDVHNYAEANGYRYYVYEGNVDGFSFRLDLEKDEYVIIDYTGSENHVVYPTTILGKPVTHICGKESGNNYTVKSIVIPEGITTISDFSGYKQLREISLPNTLVNILDCTFENTVNLKTIEIPASVKYMGSMVFHSQHTVICYSMDVVCAEWCFWSECSVYGYSNSTLKRYAAADEVSYFALESTKFSPDKQFAYSVASGKATILRYTGGDLFVKVPAEIDGYPVTAIGASAFAEALVHDIELPDTIKTIGAHAFDLGMIQYEGEPLVVRVPPTVTSIGSSPLPEWAREIYVLTDLDYTKLVCRKLIDAYENIAGCAQWKSGDYSYNFSYKDDKETVWEVGVGGYWGESKDITLPLEIDTYEKGVVKLIGIPENTGFFVREKLNSITLPEGYTSIGYDAFAEGCASHIYLPRSLKDIAYLPKSGITYHVYANTDAYAYVVQNGHAHEIIDADSVFEYTIEGSYATLTGVNADGGQVYVPKTLGGKSVRYVASYAFEGTGVEMISLPSTVASISANAFAGIGTEGDVTIMLNNVYVTIGEDAFEDNALVILSSSSSSSAKNYLDQNGIRYIYANGTIDGFQVKYENGGFTIQNYVGTEQSITVPNNFYGIPVRKFHGISDNNYVRSMKIASGVKIDCTYLALDCSELVHVSVPADMKGAFKSTIVRCPKVEYFVIPEGITSIDIYPTMEVQHFIILSRNAYISNFGCAPETATVYGYTGTPAEEYGKIWSKFVDLSKIGSLTSPVSLNLLPMTIEAEIPTPVEMIVYPENEYAYVWSSSDESIATVENGVVTGVSDGTADITVTAGTKSATATITILTPLKDFSLAAEKADMPVGHTMMLGVAERIPAAAPTAIRYSVSDDTVISVDANGNVTALAAGQATLTASSTNGIVRSCEVSVFEPATRLALSHSELEIPAFESAQLTATVTSGSETLTNRMVTFTSSNTDVAQVDQNGLVTLVGNGDAVITVSVVGNEDMSAQCRIIVTGYVYAERIEITGESIVDAGKNILLSATILPAEASDRRVKWMSSDESIATVKDGVVSGVSGGSVNITAFHADNVLAIYAVTVRPKATDIQMNTETLELAEMDAFSQYPLSAVAWPEGSAAEKITGWTSSDESIVSVNQKGLVTALRSGTAVITAESANGFTAACQVDVVSDPAVLRIPDGVVEIEEEAFAGMTAVKYVYLPDGMTTIGKAAFKGCDSLLFVRIPGSVTSIALDAFDGCGKLCITCPEGSMAQRYAETNGLCHIGK